MASTAQAGYQAKATVASNLLYGMRAITRVTDRIYFMMAWVCGLELLLLGFFITYQVLARKLGWVMAPATDVMSGYVLAMAATWAFSYSLRSGSHVRIDVLLPYMSKNIRAIADWMAVLAVAFFAYVTTWKMWANVVDNYTRGVVTNDYPLTPLFIPKIVVALGFTLLVITAVQMMLSMITEAWLPRLHKKLGGDEIQSINVMGNEEAAAAA
ncbi:MAG: TRAP transporter small permease [SAR202 cluster bacterium]|jgi:TRAP-type C4-dicarboxylate transport system permease small subunit|nr:TRAP transporter small permease [SAR202 cluster bacterium]|tara:strand:- start:1798 stop:2433 length:636 start_codon:yes stop_codon:yes gene_type:complete